MSLKAFLKQNVKKIGDVEYSPSDRFLDDDGKPVMFKLRVLSAKEDSLIRESCMQSNNDGVLEFNTNLYSAKLATESITYPNLKAAELQDDYGVSNPEDLILVMLTNGEYLNLQRKITELSGIKPFDKKVKEAKN